jgi:hypothetical protein
MPTTRMARGKAPATASGSPTPPSTMSTFWNAIPAGAVERSAGALVGPRGVMERRSPSGRTAQRSAGAGTIGGVGEIFDGIGSRVSVPAARGAGCTGLHRLGACATHSDGPAAGLGHVPSSIVRRAATRPARLLSSAASTEGAVPRQGHLPGGGLGVLEHAVSRPPHGGTEVVNRHGSAGPASQGSAPWSRRRPPDRATIGLTPGAFAKSLPPAAAIRARPGRSCTVSGAGMAVRREGTVNIRAIPRRARGNPVQLREVRDIRATSLYLSSRGA